MVEPLVLEARAESVVSLSIAGVDSRYYSRRLEDMATAAAAKEGGGSVAEEEEEQREECHHHHQQQQHHQQQHHLDDDMSNSCNTTTPDDTAQCDASVLDGRIEEGDDDEMAAVTGQAREKLCMGDHVFKWRSYLGIPFAYQHHAIVMEVFQLKDSPDAPQRLRVADFSNWAPEEGMEVFRPNNNNNNNNNNTETNDGALDSSYEGCIQTFETDAEGWHKVQYEVGFWKRHLSWSGTCTRTPSDPPGMVRARVQFLVDNPHLIPSYNAIQSNCECVAMWCKTGTWSTLQAASWLSTAAAGQVKSAATLAGAATATQVSVPAAGVWGWMGYTTQVSLASTQPLLLPAIAAFGVITVGVPAVSLALARRHWNKMTTTLNTAFWEAAVAQPDLFVECITYWSTQHDTSSS